jgi:predicted HAD superfamily phosphohydrolase
MTNIQLLSELSNKDKVQSIVKNVKAMVLEGEVNPLEVAVTLKGMEDFTKSLRSDVLIQDATLEELEKYGSKSVTFNGAKFNIRETAVSYDYSQCNDKVWNDLNAEMSRLKEAIKQREEFLKAVKSDMTVVDENTGEVYTISPAVKSSKTGYAVTL